MVPSLMPVSFLVQQSKGSHWGGAGVGGQLDEVVEGGFRLSVQHLQLTDFLVPPFFVGCGEFRAVAWHWNEFRTSAVSRQACSFVRVNKSTVCSLTHIGGIPRLPLRLGSHVRPPVKEEL